MSSVNSCDFSGWVVGTPRSETTQNGTPVLKFTLQIQRTWGGEKSYMPVFCVLYGDRVRSIESLVHKGVGAAVSTEYSFREYEVSGSKRQNIEFVVREIHILDYGDSSQEDAVAEEEEEDVPF